MRRVLLPSGRVTYRPMTDHLGEGRLRSLVTGEEDRLEKRRKVVAPSGTAPVDTPRLAVDRGARRVIPDALPRTLQANEPSARFVIVGAGKMAMDVGVWLLGIGMGMGMLAERIGWAKPWDSWHLGRLGTHSGGAFFQDFICRQATRWRHSRPRATPTICSTGCRRPTSCCASTGR